jgi:hypothetical protein
LRKTFIPALLLALAACSRAPEAGWLVTAGSDTVTVAEAAAEWERMPEQNRSGLEASGSPAEGLADYLAGRAALRLHALSTGFTGDESADTRARAWLRENSADMAREAALIRETALVDSADLAFYRRNEGLMVWFTMERTGPMGPLSLTDLPRDLADALARTPQGGSAEVPSLGTVRLDSLYDNMPGDFPVTEPDSALAAMIGYGRQRFLYLAALSEIRRDPLTVVDPAILDPEAAPPDSGRVVLAFSLDSWTYGRWTDEMDYLSRRDPYFAANPRRADQLVEKLLMDTFHENMLGTENPQLADSLATETERVRENAVLEQLLESRLDSVVTITPEEIHREYLALPEPVTVPELRLFRTAASGVEDLPSLRAAAAVGDLPGERPEDPFFREPVPRSGIPGPLAEALFGIPAADTLSWHGPFQFRQDTWLAFRLVQAFPARPATEEELRPGLEMSARSRLEAEETARWLGELRERYGVRVNAALLESLNPDPGTWR